MQSFKVLFLCSDNYTRSVTAEFCFLDYLKRQNIDFIEVSSAGTNASSDISKLGLTHFDRMKSLGIDFSNFKRTQLDLDLIREQNLVIGMAKNHQDFVLENYGIHIPLYRELVEGKHESLLIGRIDDCEITQELIAMVDYLYQSTPTLFTYIVNSLDTTSFRG